MDDPAARIVVALGPAGARELLDVLTRSDDDRAALIGRPHSRGDADWLADVLIDLEADEFARSRLVDALARVLQGG